MLNKREPTEAKSRGGVVNFIKQIVYIITIILTITYIVYRIGFTLPTQLGALGLILSIIILVLEIWEALDFFAYYLNILSVNKKSPKTPKISNTKLYDDVDVLIATLNESESLLRNTIESCKKMKYPDKSKVHIYVCDDGSRANIKVLADELGVNYITRHTNEDAKAGNYNHALKKITSPFVATFDADMVPTENFLLKTVPFLIEDEKIGFVQLPQSFKNPDIFQTRFGLSKKIPFEQDYFYHSIQIAKNATNSAIYCGTNTVFRRKALDDAKGFAKNTISEDIATGMQIESKGYKGVALNDVEAYGLAVEDVTGFIKQRSRWARGCIQIFKNHKIIRNSGLRFRQKIEYLSCISYWFFGLKRMLYMIAPLLFSIFGIIIVDCDLKTFIAIWLPTYLLKRFVIDISEHNKRSATWNKIYETILTPALCKEVLKEFFGFGSTKFEVTPKYGASKNMTNTHKKLFLSHLILLALSIVGFIMSIFKIYSQGITVYIISFIWLISNIYYLTASIIFDLSKKNNKKIAEKFQPNEIKKYGRLSSLLIFFKIFGNKMEEK